MIKKLSRTPRSIALSPDKPLPEELGPDESTAVEVSNNGQVNVVAAKRSSARDRNFQTVSDTINQKYAGLFRRLSEN
jgi:hypothetical protein